MTHGGPRKGAGRKKGTVSDATKARKEIATAALNSGLTPLDYMLSILRDQTQDQSARFTAAKEAAPYVHPRLAAVEHSGDQDKPFGIQIITGVPRDEQEPEERVNGLNGHDTAH